MPAKQQSRILVAEDDRFSREIIQKLLLSWGYEVEIAENGQQAMMALRRVDSPTIALLDWEMPLMNGLEICSRVREAGRTVYIIMLTSREGKSNMIEALEAGADDYLVKPCDRDELQARLHVGERIMRLQRQLSDQILELRDTKEELNRLRHHAL